MSKDKRRKGKEREVAASPVSSSASPMSRRPTNTASSSSLRAGKSSRSAAPSGESKQPHRSQTEKRLSASIQHVERTRRYSESEPDDEGPPRRTPDDLRKRLLTLLINDPRHQDPQLEEIWVNMRKAPGIDGMWVEALDVTKLLQNAPGKIEGPAKVYAKRQSYRQIFMTVSVDGSYACKPTNLHVPDGRSLQLWVDDWKSDPELLRSRMSPRYHPYSRQDDGQSREDRRTASPASQVRRTSRSDAGQSIKYSHREESSASRSPSPERMSVVTTTVSSRSMTESLPPSVPSVPSSPAHRLSSFLTTHFDIPVVRGPSIDLLRRIKRRSSSPLPSASADVIDLTAMDSDHEPPKVKQEPDFEPLPQQDWMQESSPQPELEPEPEPVFRQPPQMSQSTSGPSSQSTVQPMSQLSSQPTPSPAPQQTSPPEARLSSPRQALQPAASETPRDRVLSGGFGAFGSPSTVVPSNDASRRSSGFASFSNRNLSGGFGSFASTPSGSGSRTFTNSPTPGAFGTMSTTPPSLGFGAFAQSPASFGAITAEPTQAAKSRKAFLERSEPATLHDKMVEHVRSLLEEDPGWDAFLGARRQLLPMVHYIQHLRWQKGAVERLNGEPFPAELGAEQGATITKDLIMSAFHAQPSYEATLDRILELYALYGPGAAQEDPQAVSVLNERPVSTPTHQVKKCLLVLEEVHARLQGGS